MPSSLPRVVGDAPPPVRVGALVALVADHPTSLSHFKKGELLRVVDRLYWGKIPWLHLVDPDDEKRRLPFVPESGVAPVVES